MPTPSEPAVLALEPICHRAGTRIVYDTARPGGLAWAYPTSFDLALIERVCNRLQERKVPWVWPMTACARTIFRLAVYMQPGIERIEEAGGVEHHALDDARQQCKWVAQYVQVIRQQSRFLGAAP